MTHEEVAVIRMRLAHAPTDIATLLEYIEELEQRLREIQCAMDDTESAFPLEDALNAILNGDESTGEELTTQGVEG